MDGSEAESSVINRSQGIVLGFFVAAVGALVAILIAAPDVYTSVLKPPTRLAAPLEIAFLTGLIVFIGVLAVGVIRRWRWMFWLIVVAFLAGILRVVSSILVLAAVLPTDGPAWYVVFQGVVGVVQFAIGMALLAGYRKAGVWGPF